MKAGSQLLPVGAVLTSILSLQFGAAFATTLFSQIGPAGATTLRLTIAAIILASSSARDGADGRTGSAKASSRWASPSP